MQVQSFRKLKNRDGNGVSLSPWPQPALLPLEAITVATCLYLIAAAAGQAAIFPEDNQAFEAVLTCDVPLVPSVEVGFLAVEPSVSGERGGGVRNEGIASRDAEFAG